MEQSVRELRRWIRGHYAAAPNLAVLLQVVDSYAHPLVGAFEALLASLVASEWLVEDVRGLYRSIAEVWRIVSPPPRTLSAADMEQRLREAARDTLVAFREVTRRWVSEYDADDNDPFVVTDADLHALQQVADALAPLAALKSPESVHRRMAAVLGAAHARRDRHDQRRREARARRLLQVHTQRDGDRRELDARKRAAREQGLSLGAAKRTRPQQTHGMLHPYS